MSSTELVFSIEDIRKKIFSYLRKKPLKQCFICNKILVWDKKVNEYISYKPNIKVEYAIATGLVNGDYCINCWASNGPFSSYFCTIS